MYYEKDIYKYIGCPIYATVSTTTIDTGKIRGTTAAIKFYAEQVAQRKLFDATEKENEHYRVSDLPADWNKCQNSVWESKCQESSFYEMDCDHSVNCAKINGCSCTNKREVAKNEERLNPGRKKKRTRKKKQSKKIPKQTEDKF